ncbi:MAG TPA: flagellar FlbD family protein [Bacilli bacterium]
MIPVTRLNGKQLIINAFLIESMESTPDTIITLTTGKKIIVLEPIADVISLVKSYMREIGIIGVAARSQDSEVT